MKKLAVVLLVLVVALGCVFAEGNSETAKMTKVGIAVPTADHGWTGGVGWWADKAVEELGQQYPNIYFRVLHAANTTEQVKQVEDLMTWGMNYLVILPHEGSAMHTTIKACADQGVKCIVVDRGFDATQADFGYIYYAGDNAGLGRLSGDYVRDYMKANGLKNYVALGGMATPIDTTRMEEFFAAMEKDSSLVNLEGGRNYQFTNWDTQVGLSVMENLLQKHRKIDAVYCQDDNVLTGVLQAIKEARRTDIKLVLGGAGSKEVYKMIIDGDALVSADVTYPPRMIYNAIMLSIDYISGAKAFPAKAHQEVIEAAELITKANVDKYYEPNSAF